MIFRAAVDSSLEAELKRAGFTVSRALDARDLGNRAPKNGVVLAAMEDLGAIRALGLRVVPVASTTAKLAVEAAGYRLWISQEESTADKVETLREAIAAKSLVP